MTQKLARRSDSDQQKAGRKGRAPSQSVGPTLLDSKRSLPTDSRVISACSGLTARRPEASGTRSGHTLALDDGAVGRAHRGGTAAAGRPTGGIIAQTTGAACR